MTYDCQICGACCIQGASYGSEEIKSLSDKARLHVVMDGGRKMFDLKTVFDSNGREVCAAFSGEIGKKCGCSIYNNKPKMCGTFQAGSRFCIMARKNNNLEV